MLAYFSNSSIWVNSRHQEVKEKTAKNARDEINKSKNEMNHVFGCKCKLKLRFQT